MSNDVFANGREISCKKGDGKTICEFPDVCFTPPENPATPPGVPVPYPNTALSSDTTEGSKTVKISGEEIMLKNSSYFKTSSGDEAGAAAKKGVITSTNKGKAYFIAWSMDVKFEGENVVRHLDMTTNNHASPMANGSVPMIEQDSVVPPEPPKPCIVGPYDEIRNQCPDGHQAHHIVPDYTARTGTRVQGMAGQNRIPNLPSFGDGPSICLEGHARTPGSAHNIAHQCDQAIATVGQQTDVNRPVGTAPAGRVVEIATQSCINARPDCEQQIRNAVDDAYGDVSPNQLMRSTQQPSVGDARAQLATGNCTPAFGPGF